MAPCTWTVVPGPAACTHRNFLPYVTLDPHVAHATFPWADGDRTVVIAHHAKGLEKLCSEDSAYWTGPASTGCVGHKLCSDETVDGVVVCPHGCGDKHHITSHPVFTACTSLCSVQVFLSLHSTHGPLPVDNGCGCTLDWSRACCHFEVWATAVISRLSC